MLPCFGASELLARHCGKHQHQRYDGVQYTLESSYLILVIRNCPCCACNKITNKPTLNLQSWKTVRITTNRIQSNYLLKCLKFASHCSRWITFVLHDLRTINAAQFCISIWLPAKLWAAEASTTVRYTYVILPDFFFSLLRRFDPSFQAGADGKQCRDLSEWAMGDPFCAGSHCDCTTGPVDRVVRSGGLQFGYPTAGWRVQVRPAPGIIPRHPVTSRSWCVECLSHGAPQHGRHSATYENDTHPCTYTSSFFLFISNFSLIQSSL